MNRKNFPGATWSRTRRPFRRKGGGSGVPHFPTSSRSPRGFPYSPTRERETNQSALPVDNRGRETDQSSSTQPHPKGRSLDERFRSGREASAASPSFPLLFFLFPIFFSSPSFGFYRADPTEPFFSFLRVRRFTLSRTFSFSS